MDRVGIARPGPLRTTLEPRPSFEDVYDAHFDYVWRCVRRLGVEPSNIDDVMQEVFFVVHRRLPEFEGRSSVKTWLFSIALHVVRHYRRTVRRKEVPKTALPAGGLEAIPDGREVGPLRSVETSDDLRLVDRLLQGMDDEKREVFVLAHVEQMSAVEIAEILGQNLNTVYSRLGAARREFEQALARERARDAWRQP